MPELYPMVIQPRFDERIWGGHNLAERLGLPAPKDKAIGEAWEIYEENTVVNGPYAGRTIGEMRGELGRDLTGHVPPDHLFPMLTKIIDAQDALSVQVHPDDVAARKIERQPYGKTECWYIIDAAPGSELTYGFARDTRPEEYEALVETGKLQEILRSLTVKAGDVVYLPAGMVHAIGAGILLFELQQTSDVTYRIYDWGRVDASGQPRALHVEQAKQVLDYHRAVRGPVRTLSRSSDPRNVLIGARYFCLELTQARGDTFATNESAVAICALDVPLTISAGSSRANLLPYTSLLVPAAAGSYILESAAPNPGRALVAYVPRSAEAMRAELSRRGYAPDAIDAFLAQFSPARGLGQAAH